jgi:hypothetical protein
MERVNFKFKNGHTRVMGEHQAKVLGKLGHGTYMTRDMVASRGDAFELTGVVLTDGDAEADMKGEPRPDNQGRTSWREKVDIDAMDKEQLQALAKERGVKVHHMAGAEKLRTALRDAEPAVSD